MKKKSNWYRHTVQILFFVTISLFALNHVLGFEGSSLLPFLPSVSLHALCPFGGVESAISFITAGTLVHKITETTMILSAFVLVMTLILGPVFCGFVCPLGTLQEFIGKIGRKIFGKKYNTFVPKNWHTALKYLRYVSLALVLVMTYNAMTLVFADVDPYYAMYHFFTGKATIASLVILGLTLVGSLFVERPWCKYLCPYGALLGLVGKISLFKIRKEDSACAGCGQCNSQCPMGIDLSEKTVVRDANCIRCLDCAADGCFKGAIDYSPVRKQKDCGNGACLEKR
jgi:polyferredoxin